MSEIIFNNISPLRYPGGKTRACNKLDLILNEHFDLKEINKVISPFFGGGSFEFHLQNKYNLKIIANDKFKPLYIFWKICQEKKNELTEKLYKLTNSIKLNRVLLNNFWGPVEPIDLKYYILLNRYIFLLLIQF